MTRLSVIIPGYNTPKKWWQRCLRSVLAAIGPEDEIIVVDDGSKEAVCEAWLGIEDSRLRIIRQIPNQGQSAARNKALGIAQGKFVTFVDSDDEVIPGCYEKCLKRSSVDDVDIIVFGVKTVWTQERLTKIDRLKDFPTGLLNAGTLKRLYDGCLSEYVWNKIYRRAFLEKNHLIFDAGICPGEDTIFNLKSILLDARYQVVPEVGYVYYRTTSSSLAKYQNNIVESLKVYDDYWWKVRAKFEAEGQAVPKMGESTQAEMDYWEMKNIWRFDSPVSYRERLDWHREHATTLGPHYVRKFVEQLVQNVVRRWFYITPIRRWNIRRMFRNAQPWKEEN